ncbi:MAG: peptidoglycan-binding domain-containing protein, partial [Gammaproteobacteria bacterium]
EPRYETLMSTRKVADHSFVWHEIHDTTEPRETRTGRQVCLVEEPARYETIERRVVETPAQTRSVEIPAVYDTVKVTRLVTPARTERIEIPTVYDTVTRHEIDDAGYMEWRAILCETNMTSTTIMDIQRRLRAAGFDPGPIDGVIGAQTMNAVNRFQQARELPVDRYLNIDTLRALDVSI